MHSLVRSSAGYPYYSLFPTYLTFSFSLSHFSLPYILSLVLTPSFLLPCNQHLLRQKPALPRRMIECDIPIRHRDAKHVRSGIGLTVGLDWGRAIGTCRFLKCDFFWNLSFVGSCLPFKSLCGFLGVAYSNVFELCCHFITLFN